MQERSYWFRPGGASTTLDVEDAETVIRYSPRDACRPVSCLGDRERVAVERLLYGEADDDAAGVKV
jgi:hypothetical protein